MSLKNDAFPSSSAFDAIQSVLQADAAGRKDAVKNAQAVFAFHLKNSDGKTEIWNLDLKNKGEVGKGQNSADVNLHLDDEDFGKLVAGKTKAQQLFMAGKLKIKGNMMKALKIEPILSKVQSKAKL